MNLIDKGRQAWQYVTVDTWRRAWNDMDRWTQFLNSFIRVLVVTVKSFKDDFISTRASALTYALSFAIVPILALFFALSKGFGFEAVIQEYLESSDLLQGSNLTPTIMSWVQSYLETAQGGAFMGVGLIALAYSVWVFFSNLEESFNSVWQINKSRSLVRQLTTYFSLLILFPVLLVLSSGISIFINNTIAGSTILQTFSPILTFSVRLIPFFLIWLTFTLLYAVMPNTKVKFWSALMAGILAGTAFLIFERLYVFAQVFLSRYNVVYGSFAAIPLLLLFIQITCTIMLIGAKISFAAQNMRNFDYSIDSGLIANRYRKFIGTFIAYIIVKRFEFGLEPVTAEDIANDNHLPIVLTKQLLNELCETKIITRTPLEDSDEEAYIPARDINQINLEDIRLKMDALGNENFLHNETMEMVQFRERYQEVVKETTRTDILLKDLI